MYSKTKMEVTGEIYTIELGDENYPLLLSQIPDPPKKLWVRGKLPSQHAKPWIAFVGSRKASPYGLQVTERLVSEVASSCVVVSGLAYGIDGLAHKTQVEQGQPTVAVLGTGLDDASIYPRSHLGLAKQILATGGALISEYSPGSLALQYHFPKRNRIIAGLCQKTVVVEAQEGSGALITANLALDYNRDVLAVPGPITSAQSQGTNGLISQGAKPVLTASDIIMLTAKTVDLNLTPEQDIIYKTLMPGPRHMNDIIRDSKLSASEVLIILTNLEMTRIVKQLRPNIYGLIVTSGKYQESSNSRISGQG